MKSTIEITFKKIGMYKVDGKLLKKEPNLPASIKKTTKEVCKNLEKYFGERNIIITTKFKVENEK